MSNNTSTSVPVDKVVAYVDDLEDFDSTTWTTILGVSRIACDMPLQIYWYCVWFS